jgi:ribosomal protein S18 acetylase RimI-like enzyme
LSKPPVIRALTEADWPQVHALVVEVASAGETYAMDVPRSEAETREFWTGRHLVVAVDNETVLGTAKMGPNRPGQGSHVGTASFIVGSAARGRGIGRAMGEYAVEWLRVNGFEAIQFNAVVSTNLAAIGLWHSLGFETIGVAPGAFRLPHRPAHRPAHRPVDTEGGSSYADLHVMYLRVKDSPGD